MAPDLKIIPVTLIAGLFGLAGATPANAEIPVALELVLAVDASSSVDAREYDLQVSGYADAFRDPDVIAAIRRLEPRGVAITYVEWSSRFRQVQSVAWTHVHNRETSLRFADAIKRNATQLVASGTALGEAVLYSAELFANNGFAGDKLTIDVSADDRYNAGSSPIYARGIVVPKGITINGLAVDSTGDLVTYFRESVIGGEGAFAMSANSFEDFGTAIKKKLLRELDVENRIASADRNPRFIE